MFRQYYQEKFDDQARKLHLYLQKIGWPPEPPLRKIRRIQQQMDVAEVRFVKFGDSWIFASKPLVDTLKIALMSERSPLCLPALDCVEEYLYLLWLDDNRVEILEADKSEREKVMEKKNVPKIKVHHLSANTRRAGEVSETVVERIGYFADNLLR